MQDRASGEPGRKGLVATRATKGRCMRIGIDVGGTHTDAVLLSGDVVVATHKALTTADVASGILDALAHLLGEGVPAQAVQAVMIGTTQFTNAVVERRELAPVAAIRLGRPSGQGLPPMIGWPSDIASALGGHVYELHGGFLYDGRALAPIDEDEIDHLIADLRQSDVRCAAITSAFSPMNPAPEHHVASRIRAAIPDMRMTLSHRIGRIGLLERENAAILNASLLPFADRVADAFRDALAGVGLTCPIYISQNDGTLMDIAFVRAFPALTFASGPTNSLRGAARLTGLDDAIVIDIGGTTSDIGLLRGGFPRESNRVVEVGGVRTNFRMPDLLAIGLGGGSIVSDGGRSIGPRSVGHRLVSEGLVFGGETLTATDIVVAAGLTSVGDPAKVAGLDPGIVTNGLDTIERLLADGIRKMKPNRDPLPVVLVGGGAILAPHRFADQTNVHMPAHSGVANAIGAAIAQIGGEAERILSYRSMTREAALAVVTEAACEVACAAGAAPGSLRVTDIEEIALPYMDDGATRVRAKVVGDVNALSAADARELAS